MAAEEVRRSDDAGAPQVRNTTTSLQSTASPSGTTGAAAPHLRCAAGTRHLVARLDRQPGSRRQQMKTAIALATAATFAMVAPPWSAVQAAQVPAWCGNSGYDNGPPRERGPGSGPEWVGEPTDCRSIWRHGRYRGTDPDPNIRLQLMRYRPAVTEHRHLHRKK